ncbi:hypothetical protein ACIRSS_24220 [Amycolatopsis sp. NPDC101161]
MTAVVIVAVILFCGAIGLLMWSPSLTSMGSAPEPKRPRETRSAGKRAPR